MKKRTIYILLSVGLARSLLVVGCQPTQEEEPPRIPVAEGVLSP